MTRSVTRGTFFDQAMRTLAGPGLPALRIGRLCAAVGVTSGSFYHHFGSWDGFVAALLEHWTTEEVDRIAAMVSARPDPVERVEMLKRLALTVPHDAETAIRRWAGTDPVVAAAQRQVDERRRRTLRDVLGGLIADEDLCATLAEVGMSILVGHQQLHRTGPGPDLDLQFDQYEILVRRHALEPAEPATATAVRTDPVPGDLLPGASGSG